MKNLLNNIYFFVLITFVLIIGCEENNTVSPSNGNPMHIVSIYQTNGYNVDSYIKTISGVDYSFLALGPAGIQILNVTNPTMVQPISSYSVTGYSEETSILNSNNNTPYLFVAGGTGGITVLSLSNMTNPSLDTIISFSGDYINSVFIDTSRKVLFSGGSFSKVYLMDISSLPIVSLKSTYQTASYINEIQTQMNVAFVAQDSGLDIIDVSNLNSPTRINYGSSDDYAYDVKIDGNLAIISNNQNGVVIFDISNLYNPLRVSVLNSYDVALASTVNGNYVYVAEDQSGVETFDISDPYHPKYVAYYSTSSFSENLVYYKGNVFVSDYNNYVILRYP